jgi:2-dehydropantoate 2-reductase
MKITIFGAGAIGSLLGAILSKHHDVTLIGRPPHITTIQNQGLTITGKTQFYDKIPAHTSLENTPTPELIIITVKAYDTATAANEILSILTPTMTILTLQNGLGNIETLSTKIPTRQILAGVITHGAHLTTPGIVAHTGEGDITIGELDGIITDRASTIATAFTSSGLPTTVSEHITYDIWSKTIINSSINPLTAFFTCTNGYLQTNPILAHMVDCICDESTQIAQAAGIPVTTQAMQDLTRHIIHETAQNSSSMLQSIQHNKPTEIDSINAALVETAKRNHVNAPLNRLITSLIHWKEKQNTHSKKFEY